ncbi:MAG TPA: FAD-binding protein [Jatrophihabitantaceae bacterium]|nr:FAD-binding protein [Jatrophihabitantaceae bacterium]
MTGTNWARNVAFQAKSFAEPVSLDELRAIVGRSDRVRALGTRHSFSRIADTTGTHVSLAGLPPLIEIDSAARRVRVGGGIRYTELAPRLTAAGWALPNLASLPHITVAGACATATHGSGDGNGNLATPVVELEMVTAAGDMVTIDSKHSDFYGAVVGLGRLGIVSALTLDLVPSFEIAQYVYDDVPNERLDADFDAIFASGYSVSVFTDLGRNQLWCKRLAADPVPPRDWFGAGPAAGPRNPVPGMPVQNATEQGGVPGPWHARLPHFRAEFTPSAGAELQSEYLLPRSHAVAALQAVRELRDEITAVLQICELRTVAADELWLSPSYRRPTVGVHFTWVDDTAAVMPVVAAVEERLAPFEPRPHWGKVYLASGRYERLADFTRLAQEFDPAGKFGQTS